MDTMSSAVTKATPNVLDTAGSLTVSAMRKRLTPEVAKAKAEAIKASATALDRVAGAVMWDASLMLANGIDYSALVGSGEGQATQGDYASALGFKPGYASRLVRCGRAAFRHGVRKGSTEWAILASRASDTAWKPILGLTAEEYAADKAKVDKAFTALMAQYVEAKAKGKDKPEALTESREARPEGNTKAEGQSDAEAKAASSGLIGSPADLRVHLTSVVFPSIRRFTDGEAETVIREILAGVKSEQDRRTVLAEAKAKAEAKATEHGDDGKAAKVTGTPATVAKAKAKATEAEPKA